MMKITTAWLLRLPFLSRPTEELVVLSRLRKLSSSFTMLVLFIAVGIGGPAQSSSGEMEGQESSTANNGETEREAGQADTDNNEKEDEKSAPSDNFKPVTRPAQSRRIVIVVSKKNPVKSLTIAELKRIFLRKKIAWPNRWSITVFERHTHNPIRQEFSELVLKKKPKEFNEYWTNLLLTRGVKRPKACRSPKLVAQ